MHDSAGYAATPGRMYVCGAALSQTRVRWILMVQWFDKREGMGVSLRTAVTDSNTWYRTRSRNAACNG